MTDEAVKPAAEMPAEKTPAAEKPPAEESPKQQAPHPKRREAPRPRVYEPKPVIPQSEMSFEDKLLHFKQASEEKSCDLKRGSERRGGSRSRRS